MKIPFWRPFVKGFGRFNDIGYPRYEMRLTLANPMLELNLRHGYNWQNEPASVKIYHGSENNTQEKEQKPLPGTEVQGQARKKR